MNSSEKYAIFGLFGVVAVAAGSLLFALVIDGSGDSTGRVFVGGLGLGLHITGIGVIIASVWAYLNKSH